MVLGFVLGSGCWAGLIPEVLSADNPLMAEVLSESENKPIRMRACLNGFWNFMPVNGLNLKYPPEGNWEKILVPSYWHGYFGAWKHACWAQSAWYMRTFIAPSIMKGKRIALRFEGVAVKSSIYLNGEHLLEHCEPLLPFEIDITRKVKWDNPNELVLGINGTESVWLHEKSDAEHGPFRIMVGNPDANRRRGIWRDAFLMAYPSVKVDSAWIIPSTRKKQLRVELELQNDTADEQSVEVRNTIEEGGLDIKTIAPSNVVITAGGKSKLVLTAEWSDPKLWFPETPNLYYLKTELIINNKIQDAIKTRFGFREFWIEGENFMLNGRRYHLRGITESFSTPQMHTEDSCRLVVRTHKGLNANSARFDGVPNHCVFDVCDEDGLLVSVISHAVNMNLSFLESPEFRESLHNYIAKWIKEYRNHPSIAIWSLENEMYWGGCDPAQLYELARTAKEADPYRPAMFDGDCDLAGRAEIYSTHQGNHRCQEIIKGTPQEWKHDKPFYESEFYASLSFFPWRVAQESGEDVFRRMFKKGKPMMHGGVAYCCQRIINSVMSLREANTAGIAVFPFVPPGDEIFLHGMSISNKDYTTPGVKLEGIPTPLNQKVFYNSFIPDKPSFIKDERYYALQKAFLPVVASLNDKGSDPNLNAGGKFERDIIVYNDSLDPGEFQLTWEAKTAGETLAQGVSNLHLDPGFDEKVRIDFQLPRVLTKVPLSFSFRLRWPKGLRCITNYYPETCLSSTEHHNIYSGQRGFTIWPQAKPPEVKKGDLAVYDKTGLTKTILRNNKIEFTECDDIPSSLTNMAKALIIGCNSLDEKIEKSRATIAAFVNGGGYVLCLEQQNYTNNWLPVAIKMRPQASSGNFVRYAPHPIVKGIGKNDLFRIRSKGDFEKPVSGAFKIIVDKGVYGQGLTHATLLELPYGRGSYILNQIMISSACASNWVAGKLLANLIQYITEPPPVSEAKVAVLAARESKWISFWKKCGLEFDNITDRFSAELLDAYQILLIDGTGRLASAGAADAVKRFVSNGNIVIINELTPATLGDFNVLLPTPIELAKITSMHQNVYFQFETQNNDPLLAGLSLDDFCEMSWKGPFLRSVCPALAAYGIVPRADKFTSLLVEPENTLVRWPWGSPDAPVYENKHPLSAMVSIPSGKGRFIINQMTLADTCKIIPRSGRIQSAMLSNLGAKLRSHAPVVGDDCIFLDFACLCNRSFKNDSRGFGGVDEDHGPNGDILNNDLRGMPVGIQTFAGIPFKVINPDENQGKSVISLRGKHNPTAPEKVKGIKINGQIVKRLYFLHMATWCPAENTEIARYVIHYGEGGFQETIPVLSNVHVRDWHAATADLFQAKGVTVAIDPSGYCSSTTSRTRNLYVSVWDNPHPDHPLETIDFVSNNTEATPVLIAITGSK